MKGVFVIGTDTGVGKTVVCAGLLKLLHGTRDVAYWKPIQTGAIISDDFHEVLQLTGFAPGNFREPHFRFPEPLTPHMAAKKWGKEINVQKLVDFIRMETSKGTFLVVEGAGGVIIPLNEKEDQLQMIQASGLPVLIVGQDRVGTVNQTLLTLKALRDAKVEVLGVVLSRMRGTFGNAETISEFGKVEVLAQLPDSQSKSMLVGEVANAPGLRELFQVPKLP